MNKTENAVSQGKKSKIITVYGIYLLQNSSSLQVLLVKENSSKMGFRLPGRVVKITKRGRQVRREKHILRKSVYLQSNLNLKAKEPGELLTCMVYASADEIYKAYLLEKSENPVSERWSGEEEYTSELFDLEKIIRDEEGQKIEYVTELILKNFCSLRWRKQIKSHSLIPVRPLAVAS